MTNKIPELTQDNKTLHVHIGLIQSDANGLECDANVGTYNNVQD